MAEVTVTADQVEQMIYRCRGRQLHARQFGTPTAEQVYEAAVNRWLDLWRDARLDGAVRI